MLGRPCFEVEFSDGTVIVADAEHQWPTESGIRTTAQLRSGSDRLIPAECFASARAAAPRCLRSGVRGVGTSRRHRAGALRPGRQRVAPLPRRRGHGAHAQFDTRTGLPAVVLHQEPAVEHRVLAGNEQVRDRHAAAVGRGEDQAGRHAVGPDERRRLDAAGAAHERDQRGAALHRRLAEPDHDGDPRQGAPAAARRRTCGSSSSTTCS